MSEQKDPEYVARGLKATVHNPRTSEEAKANAAQRLDEMGVEPEEQASSHKAGTDAPAKSKSKKGGSATHTDTSKEADVGTGQSEEQRVMGGYRATLKNPRVSQEAKEHAKEVLKEHGEPFSTR